MFYRSSVCNSFILICRNLIPYNTEYSYLIPLIVETRFLEVVMSLLEFSTRIHFGTFSILLTIECAADIFVCLTDMLRYVIKRPG